jgi:hypothetical protein
MYRVFFNESQCVEIKEQHKEQPMRKKVKRAAAVVVVLLLLLLRVRIPQVHLPHPRPVPLSAVIASAPKHTHTQIAHRTNPDRHFTPHVPARCSPLTGATHSPPRPL